MQDIPYNYCGEKIRKSNSYFQKNLTIISQLASQSVSQSLFYQVLHAASDGKFN